MSNAFDKSTKICAMLFAVIIKSFTTLSIAVSMQWLFAKPN